MDLTSFMYNEKNHSICYNITVYEVHTVKSKNKKEIRDIFVYNFLFYTCLFVGASLL